MLDTLSRFACRRGVDILQKLVHERAWGLGEIFSQKKEALCCGNRRPIHEGWLAVLSQDFNDRKRVESGGRGKEGGSGIGEHKKVFARKGNVTQRRV